MPHESLPVQADLGDVAFSPGAEDWIEFGPAHARERVGFHDYAALYAVPGLYERVFQDELGMCTAQQVVGLYAETLEQLCRQPADERTLDLGAGNGLGGEELRRVGVGRIVGVDIEPAARKAALRDRPGAYDHYIVGDLASLPEAELASIAAMELTAVLALSALGPGHAPPTVLDTALRLLTDGGVFAFAVTPALLPGRENAAEQGTGYPELLSDLFDHRADMLARHEYVHRRQSDGSDHLAVAFVGRMR